MTTPRVLHPFLFSAAFVLFLFQHNVENVAFGQVVVPLVLALITTCAVYVPVRLLLREATRAGVIVSVVSVLFFSRGYVQDIADWAGRGRSGRALWLAAASGVSLAFGVVAVALALRRRRPLVDLTRILNVFAGCLVVLPLAQVGLHLASRGRAARPAVAAPPALATAGSDPDIYHILLDGYGRSDVLLERYGFDNRPFLAHLRARGFYVASRARANYVQTALAVASVLNFDYVADLLAEADPRRTPRTAMSDLIDDSRVLQLLRARGYRIVAYRSGYSVAEIRSAPEVKRPAWMLDEFHTLAVNSTALRDFMVLAGQRNRVVYGRHRQLIVHTLATLAEAPGHGGPAFVWAHVMSPHPPFVFGSQGEPVQPDRDFNTEDGDMLVKDGQITREEYVRQYRDQIAYITRLVQSSIDAILERRNRPAIILLHADHGPRRGVVWSSAEASDHAESMPILSACYWPSRDYTRLYPEITPVNAYRVMLNALFGGRYALLPDRSYFSTWSAPYLFVDVTERVRGGPAGMVGAGGSR